jgi:hypothetical protein
MKRAVLVGVILLAVPLHALAADPGRSLEKHWLGAWAVTTVETYSTCERRPTKNVVNGEMVKSPGRQRFPVGEIARVEAVELGRSRLDLHLILAEPMLLARRDGPYTLYEETRCRVALEITLPRTLVREGNIRGIEKTLAPVLERHLSAERARRSKSWNRRRRASYPEEYGKTLVEHAVWKVETLNRKVQSRFDRVLEKTSRLTQRLGGDSDYLAAFSEGARDGRSVDFDRCPDLLDTDLDGPAHKAARSFSKRQGDQAKSSELGYRDGYLLVAGLELLHRLSDCFVTASTVSASLERADD